MSLGAVQKAFPSKDAHAARDVRATPRHSVPQALVEPGRPTLRAWLVDLMVSVLPLDEPRRAAELQGGAFVERAAFDPGSRPRSRRPTTNCVGRSHDWCVGPTPKARCRNRWTPTPRRGLSWRSCRAWPANCCTTLPPRTPSGANAGGSLTRCYATDARPGGRCLRAGRVRRRRGRLPHGQRRRASRTRGPDVSSRWLRTPSTRPRPSCWCRRPR